MECRINVIRPPHISLNKKGSGCAKKANLALFLEGLAVILGAHVSAAGKIYESLSRAKALGCEAMQIFSRNPQQWRADPLGQEDIKEFRNKRAKLGISPVVIHIPYLINLASPNPKLYVASIKSYVEDILEADALGADYIVTHMGSHKETSEFAGIRRLTQALNKIINKTIGVKVKILLENTSGSGSWLGYKFAHQKKVMQGIKQKERVGLCLDTAHAYLAGYNIASEEGLEFMLSEIDKMVGLDLIKLIHLNDAKDKLGSKHDVHEHIGKGNIGLEGMRRIINHPKLSGLPFILETPKKSEEDDLMNLALVKKLRIVE